MANLTWTSRRGIRGALVAAAFMMGAGAQAQDCELTSADRARFQSEHLVGGPSTSGALLVRRGYVAQYDAANRVPRWVAWHLIPDFRNLVGRNGQWARFRTDNSVSNPVADSEYNGLYRNGDGYARGHMAPYFMGGGDRDGDSTRAPDDPFDACTIYEINYMSNIAPQYHNRFNGAGGLWYALETLERETILPRGTELHIITGTIFAANPERIGPRWDIGVPDMFYRILVTESGVVPFLFVHKRRVTPSAPGCELNAVLESCIVTIAEIERLADADFFSALPDADERRLETSIGRDVWRALVGR